MVFRNMSKSESFLAMTIVNIKAQFEERVF